MKVNIKKITLFVIALAAAYYMVPAQALTKKELQGREQAIKKFLDKSDLSESDKEAFDALVGKLRGTMYAHLIPNYQQRFHIKLRLKDAGAVLEEAGDISPADKNKLKEALEAAQAAVQEKTDAYNQMAVLATGLAILLLDAFNSPDSFATKKTTNQYKAAYRDLMQGDAITIGNNSPLEIKGLAEDNVTEGKEDLKFSSGNVADALKDRK